MSYAANPRVKQSQDDLQQEPTGAVASDSLAAESIQAGEGFSENDNAVAMSVKGANSTLNTTDTSGASVLHPARDGAERERQDAMGLGRDEKGSTGERYPGPEGQGEFDGTHSLEGYVGGSGRGAQGSRGSGYTGDAKDAYSGATGDSFGSGSGSGVTGSSATKTAGVSSGPGYSTGQGEDPSQSDSAFSRDNTTSTTSSRGPLVTGRAGDDYGTSSVPLSDTAPNYAATVSGGLREEGELKPKGRNLVEGDLPETKTFTGNVGGQHDPGRLAEQEFNKMGAEGLTSAGGLNYGGSGKDSETSNQYDVLGSERA